MTPYLHELFGAVSAQIAAHASDAERTWPTLVGLAVAAAPGVVLAVRAGAQAGAAATRLATVEKELEKRATLERLESFTREVDSKLDALTKAVDLKASSESMRHVERNIEDIKRMVMELLQRDHRDGRDGRDGR